MVARRLATEYAAQVFGFGVALADRILLTGLMVRFWGANEFGLWALALAAGSMVLLFDFGISNYFANRLLMAVQQGDQKLARQMVRAGNLVLWVSMLIGIVLVGIGWMLMHRPVGGADSDVSVIWIVLAIATATAARQGVSIQVALYRAHEEFARQTFLFGWTDLARIAVTVAALFAGAGPLEAAIAYLAAMLLVSIAPALFDLSRRYPDFPVRAARLERGEMRNAITTSSQYWVQSAVSTLIVNVPTVLLGLAGAPGAAIAQFALMRTLANFSRQVLTLFANVFGLEVSRRLAVDDRDGGAKIYREATRFTAVQTASATGALVSLGSGLFMVWTGDPNLFDTGLLWLALAPPVLVPSMSMALQVMATANWPKPLVVGRICQLTVTILLFIAMPIDNIAMRMMAALAIGEVLGLGVVIGVAASRKIDGIGLALHLDVLFRSAIALGLSLSAGNAAMTLEGYTGLIAGLIATGLAMVLSTIVLGLSADRRSQLLSAIFSHLSPRFQPK